jgi:uncharacterized protein (DUF983 family)
MAADRKRLPKPGKQLLDTNGEPLSAGMACPHCGKVILWDANLDPPTVCRHCDAALVEGAD